MLATIKAKHLQIKPSRTSNSAALAAALILIVATTVAFGQTAAAPVASATAGAASSGIARTLRVAVVYPVCNSQIYLQWLADFRNRIVAHVEQQTSFQVLDAPAAYTLTVTITYWGKEQSAGGALFRFLSPVSTEPKTVVKARFELATAAGVALLTGTTSSKRELANQYQTAPLEEGTATVIAGDLASPKLARLIDAASPANPSAASSTPVGAAADPTYQYDIQLAANREFFDLIAAAYRSLPTKPAAPANAQADETYAARALQRGDAKSAVAAARAAVTAAPWWPEAELEYALTAAMKAKIAGWSASSPPQVLPVRIPMRPGTPGIGIRIADVPAIVASAMGKSDLKGAIVVLVLAGSPADQAGIAPGDVIVGLNGAPVTSAPTLAAAIKAIPAGSNANCLVQRGPAQLEFIVRPNTSR